MFCVKISDFAVPFRERVREVALSPDFERVGVIMLPTSGDSNESIGVFPFVAGYATALGRACFYESDAQIPPTVILSGSDLMSARDCSGASSGKIESITWMSSCTLVLRFGDGLCFLMLTQKGMSYSRCQSKLSNLKCLGDSWLLYTDVHLVRYMLVDAPRVRSGVPTMPLDTSGTYGDEFGESDPELEEFSGVLLVRGDPVRDAVWIQLDVMVCCFMVRMTTDGSVTYEVLHRVPLNYQPLVAAGAIPQWASTEGFLFALDDETHDVRFWSLHPTHTAICAACMPVPTCARTVFASTEDNLLAVVGPHGIQIVDAEQVVRTAFATKAVKHRKDDYFRSVVGAQLDTEQSVHSSWSSLERDAHSSTSLLSRTHPLPDALKRPRTKPLPDRGPRSLTNESIDAPPVVQYEFEDAIDDVRVINGTIVCIAHGRSRVLQMCASGEVLFDELLANEKDAINITLCHPPVPPHVVGIIAVRDGVNAHLMSNHSREPLHRYALIRNEINFECLQNAVQLCMLNGWDLREIQERSLRIALDASPKAVYDVLLDVYQRESGQPSAASPFSSPSRTPQRAEQVRPRRLPVVMGLLTQLCNAIVARYDNCPDDPTARHELKSLINATLIFLSKIMAYYIPLLGTNVTEAMSSLSWFRNNAPLPIPFKLEDVAERYAVRYDTYVMLCFTNGLREMQLTIKTLAITPANARATNADWSPHNVTSGYVQNIICDQDDQMFSNPVAFCDSIVRHVHERSPSAALWFINTSMPCLSDGVRTLLGSFLHGCVHAGDAHSDIDGDEDLTVHLDAGSVLSLQHLQCIVLRLLYDNLIGQQGQPNVQRSFSVIQRLFGKRNGRILWRRLALGTVRPSLRLLAAFAYPKFFEPESAALRLMNLFYDLDRLSADPDDPLIDISFTQVLVRRVRHGSRISVALSGTSGPYSLGFLYGSFAELEERGSDLEEWTKHTNFDVAEIDDSDGVTYISSIQIVDAASQRFTSGIPPFYFPVCLKWISNSKMVSNPSQHSQLFSALFEEMLFCRRDRSMNLQTDFVASALLAGDPYAVIPVGGDRSVMLHLDPSWKMPFCKAAMQYCENHLDADAAQWLGSRIGLAARNGTEGAAELLELVSAEGAKLGSPIARIILKTLNRAISSKGCCITSRNAYQSSLLCACNFATLESIPASVYQKSHVAEWAAYVLSLEECAIPEDLIIEVVDYLDLWNDSSISSKMRDNTGSCKMLHAYDASLRIMKKGEIDWVQFLQFLSFSVQAALPPQHLDYNIYEAILHAVNGFGRTTFHPLVLFEMAEYNNESVPRETFRDQDVAQRFRERFGKSYADVFEETTVNEGLETNEVESEALENVILNTVVKALLDGSDDTGTSSLRFIVCDEMLLTPEKSDSISPSPAHVDALFDETRSECIAQWQCHSPLTKKSERDDSVSIPWRTCLSNSLPLSAIARFAKKEEKRQHVVAECRGQAIPLFHDLRFTSSVVTFLRMIHEEECQRLRVDLSVAWHLSSFLPPQRLAGALQKLVDLPPGPNIQIEPVEKNMKESAVEIFGLLCSGMQAGIATADEAEDQQACSGVFLLHCFETQYEHLLLDPATRDLDRIAARHIQELFLSGDWMNAMYDAWTLGMPLQILQELANKGKCFGIINFALGSAITSVSSPQWAANASVSLPLSLCLSSCRCKENRQLAEELLASNTQPSPLHVAAASSAGEIQLNVGWRSWMRCIDFKLTEVSNTDSLLRQCCSQAHFGTCRWLHIGLCTFAHEHANASLFHLVIGVIVGIIEWDWTAVKARVVALNEELPKAPQHLALCRDLFASMLKTVSASAGVGTLVGVVETFTPHANISRLLLNPIAAHWVKNLNTQLRNCTTSSVVSDAIFAALSFHGLRDLLFKRDEKIVSTSERLRDRVALSDAFTNPAIDSTRRERMKLAFDAVASKVLQNIDEGSPIRLPPQLPRVPSSLSKIPPEVKAEFDKCTGPNTPFSSSSERCFVIEELVENVAAQFRVPDSSAKMATVCMLAECVPASQLTLELCHLVLKLRKEAWADENEGKDFDFLWQYCERILAAASSQTARLLPNGQKVLVEVIAFDGRPHIAHQNDPSAFMTEPLIERLKSESASDMFFRQWLHRLFALRFDEADAEAASSGSESEDETYIQSPSRLQVMLPPEFARRLSKIVTPELVELLQQRNSAAACRNIRTQIFYCAVASMENSAIDVLAEFVHYGHPDLFFSIAGSTTPGEFVVVDCVYDALNHSHFAPLFIDCGERAFGRDTRMFKEFESRLASELLGQGCIGNARNALRKTLIRPDGLSENAGWNARNKVLRICSLLEFLHSGDRQACIRLGWKLLSLSGFRNTAEQIENSLERHVFLAPTGLAVCHVNWILSACYDRQLAAAASEALHTTMTSAIEGNDHDLVRQLLFSIDDVTQLKYFLDSLPSSVHFSTLTNSSSAFGNQPLHKSSMRIALLSFFELLAAQQCDCPVQMTTIYANFRHFTALGEQLKIESERLLKAFLDQQASTKRSVLDSTREALKRQNRALEEVESRLNSAANFFVQDLMFERAVACIRDLNLVAVQKKYDMKDTVVLGLTQEQVAVLLQQSLENPADILTVAHSYNISSISEWASILYRQVVIRGRRDLASAYKSQCVSIASDLLAKIHEIHLNSTSRPSSSVAANLEFLDSLLSRSRK